ncbi:kinase-like protein [Gigaspora margarita]|uniref:Kinase-like protein n=1 Tax=Gigaspora margarita TaxID=4874 RepID=A0A8H3XD92_GIGMA|nr:kinase-like protein [Gigaspora margarita]
MNAENSVTEILGLSSLVNERLHYFDSSQFRDRRIITTPENNAIVESAHYDREPINGQIAIKIFKDNKDFLDKETVRKMRNEIEVHYNVGENQNTCRLFGIAKEPNALMLVLEFADGGNLQNYLRNRINDDIFKISWGDLIQIARGVTNGLSWIHSNGIIHCDLNPQNILIHGNKPKIADFGSSKQLALDHPHTNHEGRVYYVDPQCLNVYGKCVCDEKSDIYSLGVIFWELTSGIPPFFNLNECWVIINILTCKKRESMINGTPTEYFNIYNKCWEHNPNDRTTLPDIERDLDILANTSSVRFITNTVRSL